MLMVYFLLMGLFQLNNHSVALKFYIIHGTDYLHKRYKKLSKFQGILITLQHPF